MACAEQLRCGCTCRGEQQRALAKAHSMDVDLPYQMRALEAALYTVTQELGYEACLPFSLRTLTWLYE